VHISHWSACKSLISAHPPSGSLGQAVGPEGIAPLTAETFDEAKRALYGHPAASFVAERNALVKEIRAGGDRALANEVKLLRKPSAVAAEVNQVVRSDPDGVELILQAAALLRSAQAGALDGTVVKASELQEQYRGAIQALSQSASSRRPEVRAALEAATIDEASNEDLRAGCLVVVPTPVSVFDSASGARTKPAAAQVDELEERRAKRRAEKATKAKAAEDAAVEEAAAKEAAVKEAAAIKAAADAEAERERKAAEKERQKKRKALQKRHREALRAHLGALDDEEAASDAVGEADRELAERDEQIEVAERELVELRDTREELVASRDHIVQAKAESQQRVEEAQAAVDALASELEEL